MKDNQNHRRTANLRSRLLHECRIFPWKLLVTLFFVGGGLGVLFAFHGSGGHALSVEPSQGARGQTLRAQAEMSLHQLAEESATVGRAAVLKDGQIVRLKQSHAVALKSAALPIKTLFQTQDGFSYLWVPGKYVQAVSSRAHGVWFANALGRLQMMSQDSGRTLDPGVHLQWHHFTWPSGVLSRFPHSVDQSFPGVRMQRVDETRYWGSRLSTDVLSQGLRPCPKHNPVTPNIHRTWDLFAPDSSRHFLILQDSLPDSTHPDLQGVVLNPREEFPSIWRDSGARHEGGRADIHGTHVAGVISAQRDGLGVTGVAPGFPILSVPVPLHDEPRAEGLVSLRDVVQGLAKISQLLTSFDTAPVSGRVKPKVIYLGYAFEDPQRALISEGTPLRDILEQILQHDVAVVVPAGNSGRVGQRGAVNVPAAFAPLRPRKLVRKGVLISVAASDICSEQAWFSAAVPTEASKVLYAPGERIFSTFPNADFGFLSGTSQAAAQVAGILALGAFHHPKAPMKYLAGLLEGSAHPLPSVSESAFEVDSWEFLAALTQSNVRY